ncbi:uncharacterized protein LOC125842884 [Solanum stenotomum]|uniref:uncharacterized protein LOC125842884 n=1 Tax=Solanum stenotomum TaxID=172797 RepID=UPI0020D1C96E|nr:uncharacterized protein LOC125842884 [Solanum stenotomum]
MTILIQESFFGLTKSWPSRTFGKLKSHSAVCRVIVILAIISFYFLQLLQLYRSFLPGESLPFVTPYIAMNCDILPEQLLGPFSVSIPVGESILVESFYRDCVIYVNHKDTMSNLVELDMVDFDIILAFMDLMSRVFKPYHDMFVIEEMKYDLNAIIVHYGPSISSGHYYIFIRYALNEWYKFDDEKVAFVQEDIVLVAEAYIMFYSKRDESSLKPELNKIDDNDSPWFTHTN